MKHRKHRDKMATFEKAEHLRNLASDIFIYTESHDPNYRGKMDVAITHMRKALLIDPDNYEFLVFMGELLDALDDESATAQALEYFDRAIRLQPESADAYEAKASTLTWANPPDEANAEKLARKAVELARESKEEPDELQYRYLTLLDVLEARNKFGELRWTILRARKECPSEFMKDLTDATQKQIAAKEAEAPKD
jgi:tetratricopeptide (TPR) repeat protein